MQRYAEFAQAQLERLVQRGHAVVIEAGRHGAKHRHLLGRHAPGFAVALYLLGHVAQRIGRALAVEFVNGHKGRKVQHVDFFQLAGRAELGRHHVHRNIHMRHDGRVALTYTGGLDDHQIKACHLARGDHVGQRRADLGAELARGQAAHVDPLRTRAAGPGADGVHADAVTQQSAAAFAPRRVYGNQCHPQSVALIEADAANQLVGQRRLARAAGSGHTQHRHFHSCRAFAQRLQHAGAHGAALAFARTLPVFQSRNQLRQRAPGRFAVATDRVQGARRVAADVAVTAHHHLANHPGQAHALPVLGAEDAAHAIGLQFGNFSGHDHPAAAAKHLDLLAAARAQQIHHVLEILHMSALVGAQRNALRVFLQGGAHHLIDRTVVAQVNHLRAHALQDAPHDVDGRVMPVKQTGCRHKTHLVAGAVVGEGFEFGGQIGHGQASGGGITVVSARRGQSGARCWGLELIDVDVNVNRGRTLAYPVARRSESPSRCTLRPLVIMQETTRTA